MSPKKTLFEPIVDQARLHPSFVMMRDAPGSEAARWMLDDVYRTFEDRDGNFVEQFQTTAFDQRFFELYLHAYFERTGILVPSELAVPDFFVAGDDGQRVAVEATTVNPSQSGVLAELGRTIADLDADELAAYRRHELALRYGSPLYSKLKKRYWDLPQCKDLPLVLAIQAFHDDDALGLSDSALTSYLFGLEASGSRDIDGSLLVEFNRIESHKLGEKEIPSSFFDQPDAEHVSAVLFTNSGTHGKFTRMGFQSGAGNDRLSVLRRGFSWNEDPDATDPVFFFYSLDDPPLLETWGQGGVVIHNPQALHPIGNDTFPDTVQARVDEAGMHHLHGGFHPFASQTITLHIGEAKQAFLSFPARIPQISVGFITEDEFRFRVGRAELPAGFKEESWFAEGSEFFFGYLMYNAATSEWGCRVFGLDQFFRYRTIVERAPLPDRASALENLREVFIELRTKPQLIFPTP